jgi:hypothetical protein
MLRDSNWRARSTMRRQFASACSRLATLQFRHALAERPAASDDDYVQGVDGPTAQGDPNELEPATHEVSEFVSDRRHYDSRARVNSGYRRDAGETAAAIFEEKARSWGEGIPNNCRPEWPSTLGPGNAKRQPACSANRRCVVFETGNVQFDNRRDTRGGPCPRLSRNGHSDGQPTRPGTAPFRASKIFLLGMGGRRPAVRQSSRQDAPR